MTLLDQLTRALGKALRREAGRAPQPGRKRTGEPRQARTRQPSPGARPPRVDSYPGDFTGTPVLTYEPDSDNEADPGEIVWTWVPYEEDHTRGKDRPVLIIGRDKAWLLGLPLTSRDHDRDAAQEAGEGRYWADIGSGPWDSSGRASEVRVNRILRVDPAGIRRLAGRLARNRFDEVAAEVMTHYH